MHPTGMNSCSVSKSILKDISKVIFSSNKMTLQLIKLMFLFLPIQDNSLCPDHGKEMTLFCKETQCQTLICTVCMTRKHKKHDVVDVDENRKEELVASITSAIERMSCWEEQIDAV